MPFVLAFAALAAIAFAVTKRKPSSSTGASVGASPAPPDLPPPPPGPSTNTVWSPASVLLAGRNYRASFPFNRQFQKPISNILYGVTFPGSLLYYPKDTLPGDWPSEDITRDSRMRVLWTYNGPAAAEPITALGGRIYEGTAVPIPWAGPPS